MKISSLLIIPILLKRIIILCDLNSTIINKILLNYTKAEKNDDFFKNDSIQLQDATYRAKIYYSNTNLLNYKVTYSNENFYVIRIYINPCKNFEENCCQGKASCEEDNTDIIAGTDLEIAWFVNNFLPICENEFNNLECGTFLEVHLPGIETVLVRVQINQYYVNGFQTNFIITTNLCAGRYEV